MKLEDLVIQLWQVDTGDAQRDCKISAGLIQEFIDKDYRSKDARIAELEEALKWFCSRVDNEEIYSVKTYAKFKELLKKKI